MPRILLGLGKRNFASSQLLLSLLFFFVCLSFALPSGLLCIALRVEWLLLFSSSRSRPLLLINCFSYKKKFVISITRRDEAMTPFVAGVKRNYIFGGICGIAADTSIKALADMKSINLFGVQQICQNTIALEQALAALPSIDSESVQLRLDRVRTYYELLNMPFEALLAFITDNPLLFTATEYENLLNIQVPGREIPADALSRVSEILSQ